MNIIEKSVVGVIAGVGAGVMYHFLGEASVFAYLAVLIVMKD